MSHTEENSEKILQEKPPFLNKWRNVYWMLIVFLLMQILLYYWLTQTFNV
jgi:hypothetical protein